MDERIYESYLQILHGELIPALGCTEPISIALAAAKARELLGMQPERAELCCSGNVIKNVKGVLVPNSGGEKGIPIAAALGIMGGDSALGLEVLTSVDESARTAAVAWVEEGRVTCTTAPGLDNLYISVFLTAGEHTSRAVISHYHTRFVRWEKDGEVLMDAPVEVPAGDGEEELTDPKNLLTVAGILEFAGEVRCADVSDLLERQMAMNSAIADYGLANPCGCCVGQVLLRSRGNEVRTRAMARAAAGSDARMSGCTMPVVINSGSGNQGLTVSLPVMEYAKELGCDREMLCRALVVSNLISIHQKSYIGNLSAFCGAVSAACGAGAAITYLHGGDSDAVSRTVINTLVNVGGIVCDGAKASCAAKIASSVDAAILGHELSMAGMMFQPGDGIVLEDVETTMRSIGHVARQGMRSTDEEILNIMTGEICP